MPHRIIWQFAITIAACTLPAAAEERTAASSEASRDETSESRLVAGPRDLKVCWPAGDLRAIAGEQRVRKLGTPAPLSQLETRPASQTARARTGAVRRVTLPPGAGKLVALTFDLCERPSEVAGYDGAIVDTLRDRGVRATFFAGGKWIQSHPKRAQQLMSDPLFEIANHTWGHANLRLVDGKEMQRQILFPSWVYERLRSELEESQCLDRTRSKPAVSRALPQLTLFRFPYGACNPAALEAVAAAGQQAIQWDVSSGDPQPHLDPHLVAKRVIDAVRPGSIVLFHANGRGWSTPRSLPIILSAMQSAEYQFVTVSELLATPGATWELHNTCYDSRVGDADRYDALARKLHAEDGISTMPR